MMEVKHESVQSLTKIDQYNKAQDDFLGAVDGCLLRDPSSKAHLLKGQNSLSSIPEEPMMKPNFDFNNNKKKTK